MTRRYFYPRSPCGERPGPAVGGSARQAISIHALLAESDVDAPIRVLSKSGISIHALLAESDARRPGQTAKADRFLSTLSLRRATLRSQIFRSRHHHFYPRSPCGERRVRRKPKVLLGNFYPRSPCGERRGSERILWPVMNFYPRSPCGERLHRIQNCGSCCLFLSTLSLRRATSSPAELRRWCEISIHALLAESDRITEKMPLRQSNFYPRSPCGERLWVYCKRT